MKNDYERLISYLLPIEPPQGLVGKVIKHIEFMDQRRARIRLASYAGLTLLSCAGLAYASLDIIHQFSSSGIAYYFSLFASDQALIFSYAKDFTLSIVESLPVVSLAVFLAFFGTFLWSFFRSAREVKLSFLSIS